jgi:predicted Rossmann-fold nucleotide-binding protein
MEAASEGACSAGGSVVAVGLRAWGKPNKYALQYRTARTLHARQQHLIEGAEAYTVYQGGPGTLAELTLIWSMMQSRLMVRRPLILIGVQWRFVIDAWRANLQVSSDDLKLLMNVDIYSEVLPRLLAWDVQE